MLDLRSKQVFFFDLDDTLVNTSEASELGLVWSYKKLVSDCKGDISRLLPLSKHTANLEGIYRSKTKTGRRKFFDYEPKVFENYCNGILPKIRIGNYHRNFALAARLYWQFRETKYTALMPKPGVIDLINRITTYYGAVYCVTEGKCNHQHTKLMLTGLEPMMADILVTRHKEVELSTYIRRGGFNRKEAVMIGDKQSDILAGKNARIDTVQIASKNTIRSEKKKEGRNWIKPGLIIEEIAELLEYL